MFFGNYEGYSVVQHSQAFATVPDANIRRSDFSGFRPSSTTPTTPIHHRGHAQRARTPAGGAGQPAVA